MLEKLQKICHIDINIQNQLNIILIAHVDTPRGIKNSYQIQCSSSEILTLNEFNDIYRGIVDAGFFIQNVFFNELDFIDDYIHHKNKYGSNTIIFSLARNGIGLSAKTIIPSFCDLTSIQYTTSNAFCCALARNKLYYSEILAAHNIPTPKIWRYFSNNKIANSFPSDDMKVIVKPISSSASQGISKLNIGTMQKVKNKLSAITKCYHSELMIQEYINGFECEVPIFKYKNEIIPLLPVRIIPPKGSDILTADISNNNDYEFEMLSNLFEPKIINRIMEHARDAFSILNLDKYGRIDFRITSDGQPYVIDISTTPYITVHSSFSYVFKKLGLPYNNIFSAIINCTL